MKRMSDAPIRLVGQVTCLAKCVLILTHPEQACAPKNIFALRVCTLPERKRISCFGRGDETRHWV